MFEADERVFVAVERPNRRRRHFRRGVRVASGANRRGGRDLFRASREERPSPETAHRNAGNVNAVFVDRVKFANFVDHNAKLRRRPPAVRRALRRDGEEFPVFRALRFRAELDRAVFFQQFQIVAAFARAVQHQHQREARVGLFRLVARLEDVIFQRLRSRRRVERFRAAPPAFALDRRKFDRRRDQLARFRRRRAAVFLRKNRRRAQKRRDASDDAKRRESNRSFHFLPRSKAVQKSPIKTKNAAVRNERRRFLNAFLARKFRVKRRRTSLLSVFFQYYFRVNRLFFEFFRQEPTVKFRIVVSSRPAVVIDAGIRRELNVVVPRFFDRFDEVLRVLVLDGAVRVAVERPNRRFRHFRREFNVVTAAKRSRRRDNIGRMRDQAPSSETAHRKAGNVNPRTVDRVIFANLVDQDAQLSRRPKTNARALRRNGQERPILRFFRL